MNICFVNICFVNTECYSHKGEIRQMVDAKIDDILAEVHRGWVESCRLVVGNRPYLTSRGVDREDFGVKARGQRGIDKCNICRIAVKICGQGHKAGSVATIPSSAKSV